MRTLHLVALLLLGITGVQLVVFIGLLYSKSERGDEAIPESVLDLSDKTLKNRNEDGNRGIAYTIRSSPPPTSSPSASPSSSLVDSKHQSIGLRVIGNLIKIHSILEETDRLFPPIVPDEAILVRADDRYTPKKKSADSKNIGIPKAEQVVVPQPSQVEADAQQDVLVDVRGGAVVDESQQLKGEADLPVTAIEGHLPSKRKQSREGGQHENMQLGEKRDNAQHRGVQQNVKDHRSPHFDGAKSSSGAAANFVEVIGDIHEREGRLIEERLEDESFASLVSSLIVTRPPQSLQHLRDAAVVILGHNRPEYLFKSASAVLRADLGREIKKYISIDGDDPATMKEAMRLSSVSKHSPKKEFSEEFELIQHRRDVGANADFFAFHKKNGVEIKGTMYAARHYKVALDMLFFEKQHSHVIILEDDLIVSKDFFLMFESLAPLLALDPTLWCISSWNDNGFQNFDLPPNEFFRTSYFPGLGWMLQKDVWEEISERFPVDNWDHWMRVSTTSRRRDCVVPWVSRNMNIGASGTTADAEFYQLYIQPIVSLKDDAIYKPYGDLRYLLSHRYYESFRKKLLDASTSPKRRVMLASDMLPLSSHNYQQGVVYSVGYTEGDFEGISGQLMIRSTPRAIYRHTLWLRYNKADLFLVNRRLSPFADGSFRIRRDPSLVAVVAPNFGESCRSVCRAFGGGHAYGCDADQFAFINDCSVMAKLAPQHCAAHCTQAWGEDVPNIESPFLAKSQGRDAMCLESEMAPTCDASHALTKRFCPCTTSAADSHRGEQEGGGGFWAQEHRQQQQQFGKANHGGDGGQKPYAYHNEPGNNHALPRGAQQNAHLNTPPEENQWGAVYVGDAGHVQPNAHSPQHLTIVPAEKAGVSCHATCQSYKGGPNSPYGVKGWQCAGQHFGAVNLCPVLQKYFPCDECYHSRGADLPNYVSNRDDGQYGRCLVTEEDMGCAGSHRNTQRLCPCLPEE